jgi:HD-GYP domain-containing protein (c-di-GMP phosphodiesterase class II)
MNSSKGHPRQAVSLTDEVFRVVSHHPDMGTAGEQFFYLMRRILPFQQGALYLLNEEDDFQLHETDPPGDRGFEWVHQLIEDGIIDWILGQKKVSPIPHPRHAERKATERLVVPLVVWGKGLGFVALEGPFENKKLKPESLDPIVPLASVVALALENQILAGKVAERHHRLDVLERISQRLLLITDLNRLLAFILDYALEVVPSQEAALAWLENGADTFIVRNGQGGATSRSRIHLTQMEKWVIDKASPLILNDYAHDVRFREDATAFPFPLQQTLCTPILSRDSSPGALSLFNRHDGQGFSSQDYIFLSTLASHAAIAIEIATLYRNMKLGYKETIRALVNAIEAKDPYTRGHTERVTDYALRLADSLEIGVEEKEILEYASLLHDVGKIGVSEKILRKKGPLTKVEYLKIKKHPAIGETIVKGVRFLDRARRLIRGHHERYDGRGYPDHINGESLPLTAHILILADAFDAMCSKRPYRAALVQKEIQEEFLKNTGSQFHPKVVDRAINLFFENATEEQPDCECCHSGEHENKKGGCLKTDG